MSTTNMMMEFISSVQVIMSHDADNCTASNPFVYFVVANYDAVHASLSKSIQLRFDDLHEYFMNFSYIVRQ
jgi:hypothetical protein